MRIREIRFIQARIPLRLRVQHASHSRTCNDTILVRCEMDDGSVGWGEGLPRDYVTGETIHDSWEILTSLDVSPLGQRIAAVADLEDLARAITIPPVPDRRDCFGNAARCALELAILDAGCRGLEISLSDFIRQLDESTGIRRSADATYYSAVMTAARPLKLRLRSWLYRLAGFHQCKVKVGVGGQDDVRLLRLVRSILGADVGLRIDVNEAWSPNEVPEKLLPLEAMKLSSVEQPVPHNVIGTLREIRSRVSVPIMLDESLCSVSDAERAINEELCDSFNIRLSKCGGIIPSVKLTRIAHQAGLSCQLGCQVGETGILSAAGRHFATSIAGLTAVEGSFDRFLVRERLTKEDLTFRWQGRGEALLGTGLGVSVDDEAVSRVAQRSASFTLH